MLLNSKQIAQITQGVALNDFTISNFVIDSREAKENDCFIALIGNNNNGHNYIKNVIDNKVAGIIVDKQYADANPLGEQVFKNYVIVENTTLALSQIATYVRNNFSNPIVGITGSTGKTTLKEMIAFVLEQGFNPKPVAKTIGNFNNHIGMPLCLSNLSNNASAGVFEMGMSARGEISLLTQILKPNIGIITNIASAHAEFFKSELEIAEAKIEILDGMDAVSTLILNMDDKYCDLFTSCAIKRGINNIIYFSAINPNAHIYLSQYNLNFTSPSDYGANIQANILNQSFDFNIRSIAPHNYMLFCVALAVAMLVGIKVENIRLQSENFDLPKGRGKISWVAYGEIKFMLFDDSYNANPLSMAVAIDNLASIKNDKILVLGEMLELGNIAQQEHKNLVNHINLIQYKAILCIGKMMEHVVNNLQNKNNMIKYFESIEDLQKFLIEIIQPKDVVFIKGSYSSGVNKIVDLLTGKQ